MTVARSFAASYRASWQRCFTPAEARTPAGETANPTSCIAPPLPIVRLVPAASLDIAAPESHPRTPEPVRRRWTPETPEPRCRHRSRPDATAISSRLSTRLVPKTRIASWSNTRRIAADPSTSFRCVRARSRASTRRNRPALPSPSSADARRSSALRSTTAPPCSTWRKPWPCARAGSARASSTGRRFRAATRSAPSVSLVTSPSTARTASSTSARRSRTAQRTAAHSARPPTARVSKATDMSRSGVPRTSARPCRARSGPMRHARS